MLAYKQEKAQAFLSRRPKNRLSQLAGLESILENIRELVFYPIQYPQLYMHLGVTPPCGILLHGPSGCGKTSLALAIAGELDLPFYKVLQYFRELDNILAMILSER